MTLAVSRAFMVGLDIQTVEIDSCQASGLASRFLESMNVHPETCAGFEVTLHESFFCILHVLHWLIFTMVSYFLR